MSQNYTADNDSEFDHFSMLVQYQDRSIRVLYSTTLNGFQFSNQITQWDDLNFRLNFKVFVFFSFSAFAKKCNFKIDSTYNIRWTTLIVKVLISLKTHTEFLKTTEHQCCVILLPMSKEISIKFIDNFIGFYNPYIFTHTHRNYINRLIIQLVNEGNNYVVTSGNIFSVSVHQNGWLNFGVTFMQQYTFDIICSSLSLSSISLRYCNIHRIKSNPFSQDLKDMTSIWSIVNGL